MQISKINQNNTLRLWSNTLAERRRVLLRGGVSRNRRWIDIRRSSDTWRRRRETNGGFKYTFCPRVRTRRRSRKIPIQCGPSVASAIELAEESDVRTTLRVVAWNGTGFESRISLSIVLDVGEIIEADEPSGPIQRANGDDIIVVVASFR